MVQDFINRQGNSPPKAREAHEAVEELRTIAQSASSRLATHINAAADAAQKILDATRAADRGVHTGELADARWKIVGACPYF